MARAMSLCPDNELNRHSERFNGHCLGLYRHSAIEPTPMSANSKFGTCGTRVVVQTAHGVLCLTNSCFAPTFGGLAVDVEIDSCDASRSIMKAARIPQKLVPWFEARKKYRLTHAQVQMARELGLNPKKFGGLANHRQERWKLPLPNFMEQIYLKRFGVQRPAEVLSLEEVVARDRAKEERTREVKRQRLAEASQQSPQREDA